MRIGNKILVGLVVAVATVFALNVFDVGAVSIGEGQVGDTSYPPNSGTAGGYPTGAINHYSCYFVCPPAVETSARARDYADSSYYEAVWTVLHNTNTEGQVVLYDLIREQATDGTDSTSAIRDSSVVRLLAGMTYGGDELVGDSIVVWIWDIDDTCYIFGRGTYPDRRNWQGD